MRNKEHEKAVFNGDTKNDALADHHQSCKCTIKWDEIKTLTVEPNYFRQKARESLEIRRIDTGPSNPKGMNRDYGDYVTSSTWTTLFDNIDVLRKGRLSGARIPSVS